MCQDSSAFCSCHPRAKAAGLALLCCSRGNQKHTQSSQKQALKATWHNSQCREQGILPSQVLPRTQFSFSKVRSCPILRLLSLEMPLGILERIQENTPVPKRPLLLADKISLLLVQMHVTSSSFLSAFQGTKAGTERFSRREIRLTPTELSQLHLSSVWHSRVMPVQTLAHLYGPHWSRESGVNGLLGCCCIANTFDALTENLNLPPNPPGQSLASRTPHKLSVCPSKISLPR